MFKTARLALVTCLTASLVIVPCKHALASDGQAALSHVIIPVSTVGGADNGNGKIWGAALAAVPAGSSLLKARQVVASAKENHFILGITSAGLVIGSIALLAYGTTDTCKRAHVGTSTCDRAKVLGAIGVATGTMIVVVWALSK